MKIKLLVLMLVMVLACCRPITSGWVIKKTFYPAHSTTQMTSVGKVMIPIVHHYDDRWTITILGQDPDNPKKTQTRVFHVYQYTYDAANLGEWCIYDEDLRKLRFSKQPVLEK